MNKGTTARMIMTSPNTERKRTFDMDNYTVNNYNTNKILRDYPCHTETALEQRALPGAIQLADPLF